MWIHRLQEYAAITRAECTFLIAASFLLVVGLATRYLIDPTIPVTESAYVESDRLFNQGNGQVTGQSSGEYEHPLSALDTTHAPLADSFKLNLNTAGVTELEQLPRIGPVMASRIVAYREAHGGFKSIRDLLQVNGIGGKTLERIEPFVYVEK